MAVTECTEQPSTLAIYLDICCYIDMGRPRNASHQTRLLLTTMLEQPRAWYYGYELSKATGLTSGTLYPLLMRLNDRGLLESRWQEPQRAGRPARHAYRLSGCGLELARQAATEADEQIDRRSARAAI
jgi:DNA-binding PadR family transcriptional regulator